MRCPTEDIDIDGHKVTINACDFNAETMRRWDHSEIEIAKRLTPAAAPPPPPSLK